MKRLDGFPGSRVIVLPNSVVQELENDTIGEDLHITDIGYYPQAEGHEVHRNKGINQYVLLYCVDGSGWFAIDEERYELRHNQYVILPANTPHAYGSSEQTPWTIYWIHFKGKKASFFADGGPYAKEIAVANDSRIEERLLLFEEIFGCMAMGYSMDNIHYAITCLYHFLGSLVFPDKWREAKRSGSVGVDVIEQAIHFMHDNLHRKLTLLEIAEYIHYSPSHFSSVFHKKTGFPPLDYFTRLKVQKACEMLDLHGMRINQISPQLGYDDPLYFSRVFTKIMGMSPMSFKKRGQTKDDAVDNRILHTN
ncbi:MAG: AraC family transcriptional regulator [Paludibacteraceae bacterium]|nr:AraC family transcriptional regulator [Paludibacteraceae bacterium]